MHIPAAAIRYTLYMQWEWIKKILIRKSTKRSSLTKEEKKTCVSILTVIIVLLAQCRVRKMCIVLALIYASSFFCILILGGNNFENFSRDFFVHFFRFAHSRHYKMCFYMTAFTFSYFVVGLPGKNTNLNR